MTRSVPTGPGRRGAAGTGAGTTAADGDEYALAPITLIAATRNCTAAASRPVTRALVAKDPVLTIRVDHDEVPAGADWTRKPWIGRPPLSSGISHVTVADATPATAATSVGGNGTSMTGDTCELPASRTGRRKPISATLSPRAMVSPCPSWPWPLPPQHRRARLSNSADEWSVPPASAVAVRPVPRSMAARLSPISPAPSPMSLVLKRPSCPKAF